MAGGRKNKKKVKNKELRDRNLDQGHAQSTHEGTAGSGLEPETSKTGDFPDNLGSENRMESVLLNTKSLEASEETNETDSKQSRGPFASQVIKQVDGGNTTDEPDEPGKETGLEPGEPDQDDITGPRETDEAVAELLADDDDDARTASESGNGKASGTETGPDSDKKPVQGAGTSPQLEDPDEKSTVKAPEPDEIHRILELNGFL